MKRKLIARSGEENPPRRTAVPIRRMSVETGLRYCNLRKVELVE